MKKTKEGNGREEMKESKEMRGIQDRKSNTKMSHGNANTGKLRIRRKWNYSTGEMLHQKQCSDENTAAEH